jgi:hypothetical protein
MDNSDVVTVHCSYMFWLPHSNYLLAVYQECKKEFILPAVSGQDLGLTEGTTDIGIYVCYF